MTFYSNFFKKIPINMVQKHPKASETVISIKFTRLLKA